MYNLAKSWSSIVTLCCVHLRLASATTYVPSFVKYPGYTGSLEVSGSVIITSTDGSSISDKQTLTWSLTGLDPKCSEGAGEAHTNGCGIHIHAGTSCATNDDVEGHHFSGEVSPDPWLPVVYVSSQEGSSLAKGEDVVTGLLQEEVDGRVMVVHDHSGARIACGVIGLETGPGWTVYVPSFVKYPGYTGSLEVSGAMTITSTSGDATSAKQTLTWSLTGLDSACTEGAGDNIINGCGIHIHSGVSCAAAEGVGGHYYSAELISDPWQPVVYVILDASESVDTAEVVTGLSSADIMGRVVVVHELAGGGRIACGVIGLSKSGDSDDNILVSAAWSALVGIALGLSVFSIAAH